MDAAADILRTMHLACGIFLEAEFTAPWCVSSRIAPEDCGPFAPVPRSVIALHFVSSGHVLLQVADNAPLVLEQGDIVALPRHGGGGPMARIVCGFLGTDRPNDPVLAMLPRVMKLRVEGSPGAAWIESSFRFAAQETAVSPERSPEVLTRLAEVLFVDAVRRYLATLPPDLGAWCAGMLDARIATALALLHGRMRHRWTTEALAREAGL